VNERREEGIEWNRDYRVLQRREVRVCVKREMVCVCVSERMRERERERERGVSEVAITS
jgi:hypothetical protein